MTNTKLDLEKYRNLLLVQARRLQENVSQLVGEALRKEDGPASGNLSNAPLHPGDLSADTYEHEVSLSLLESGGGRLEEIAAALDRINQGTYGQCEDCGDAIPAPRLDALPYTPVCAACAQQREETDPNSISPGNL